MKDLSGKKFGKLTVGYPIRKTKKRMWVWRCICECGKIKDVVGQQLTLGKAKSCGCSRYEGKGDGVASYNAQLSSYKSNAKQRGLVWDLTDDEYRELVSQNCYYCGYPPVPRYNQKKTPCNLSGIDRVDNKRGYITDNVVTCCAFCNRAKKGLEINEFISWLTHVKYSNHEQ
jgi:hypothetical protein